MKEAADRTCLDTRILDRARGPYQVATHGHARPTRGTSPTYKVWLNMHQRCRRGGRRGEYADISVCDRWSSFEAFLADMGERPSARHSIDRVDPRGDYEPGNCRWATPSEQARNKTTSVILTHPHTGRTMCMADWADYLGVSRSTLHWRLKNWPLDRALSRGDHRKRKPAWRRYAQAVADGDPHRDARGLDLAEAVMATVASAKEVAS